MDWYAKYLRLLFKDRVDGCGDDYLDCWGFVRLVYKNELGIDLPSYSEGYEDSEDRAIGPLIDEKSSGWIEVSAAEVKPFDVVLMRVSAQGPACHVGLVIRRGVMIHLRRRAGVVVQPMGGLEWKNRVLGVIRYAAK